MTLTYAIVADELAAAQHPQELIDASQLIQYVPDIDERQRLDGIVKRRLAEFKSAE